MASSLPLTTGRYSIASSDGANGRDNSWLLAFNRRLRNLKSISIRNILLSTSSTGRQRGMTVDDDGVPKTRFSVDKLRALHEEKTLGHSRSSADLRHQDRTAMEGTLKDTTSDGSVVGDFWSKGGAQDGRHLRSRPHKMRRRSTLEWANAGPGKRQEKLEHMIEGRMVDVFVSIHVDGVKEPVYVSEIVERTMDPTFRSLDMEHCNSYICRQQTMSVRVWARASPASQWRMALSLDVSLPSLHYLGENLGDLQKSLEANTVLFHFEDGIYTHQGSAPLAARYRPVHSTDEISSKPGSSPSRQSRTGTFDALLRLSKLTDSIEDALATQASLAADLEHLISSHRQALEERDQVFEIKDRVKTITFAESTVQKQVEKIKKQVDERRAALSRRRQLMADDRSRHINARKYMTDGCTELPQLRDERQVRKKAIAAQRRRIAEDVSKIFPIDPAERSKALSFKIRGLQLPNSEDLDAAPAGTLAAALGFVAQVLLLLSFYFDVAMPYAVTPMGSTSFISDPISLLNTSTGASFGTTSSTLNGEDRQYPLHLHRVARFRFEYAIFLLNKDIQLLLESGFGVRVLDIRQTLPNLKYLLYVATAGEGELPARKAGGVRGLVKGASGRKGSTGSGGSGSSVGSLMSKFTGKVDAVGTKGAAESLRSLVIDS